jgi:copper chaperone CopZ
LVAFVALICAPLSALGEKSKTATLNIEGMTCGVRIVLKKVGGVSDAKVSFDDKKAVVTYDPAKTTPQKMVEAINAKLPYKARVTDSGAPPKP